MLERCRPGDARPDSRSRSNADECEDTGPRQDLRDALRSSPRDYASLETRHSGRSRRPPSWFRYTIFLPRPARHRARRRDSPRSEEERNSATRALVDELVDLVELASAGRIEPGGVPPLGVVLIGSAHLLTLHGSRQQR